MSSEGPPPLICRKMMQEDSSDDDGDSDDELKNGSHETSVLVGLASDGTGDQAA